MPGSEKAEKNTAIPVVSAKFLQSEPHPEITADAIKLLVETFYGRIREHSRLGPLFEQRLSGRWPEHLQKMELFWQSVLLKNGAYKGKPVPAHLQQKAIVSSDYAEWLSVFRPVAREIFPTEAVAAEVIATAERIAESLWLATFGFAGTNPPPELRSVSLAGGRSNA